ncbi:unnamed protein product [Rotaria sordida]|uniref:Hint domain-containing protein n=3 Tax=Rotaria sordida TaxID=392033 RepID=A0A815C3X9_9BILA|nr:unnamed protein product [Rotaria sordida]
MPVIRKNHIQPSSNINDKNCEILQDGNVLFAFSSILSVKYSKGRVPPSVIPQKSARNILLSSNVIDNENYIQPSTNNNDRMASSIIPQKSTRTVTQSSTVINIEQSHQSRSHLVPTIPEMEHTHKRKPATKRSKSDRYRFRCIILFLIILFCIIIAASIAAILVGVLYKNDLSSTTTTTSTTTSATTTTLCYFGEDYINLVEGGRRQIGNLKTGDRVWTISNDGKRLIEDEIIVIPHAGPTIPAYFYTFTTIEGHTVSLTDSHFIVAIAKGENKIKIICASEVTLEHQLIMAGRTIGLEKIVYSIRIGFYSPITLSGYLTVNNLSTSVYVDYLHAPHDFLHQIGGPFRMYYRITRWLFGNNYIPFAMTVNEEIHPISAFIIANYQPIRLFFIIFPFMTPIMFIILFIYLVQPISFMRKKLLSFDNKMFHEQITIQSMIE